MTENSEAQTPAAWQFRFKRWTGEWSDWNTLPAYWDGVRNPDHEYRPLYPNPSGTSNFYALRAAAELCYQEMRHAVAPRDSFTDALDALDAALYPHS